MNALEYFNTHLRYEKNPKIKEAITQKFTEYLRRAEEIRAVLDEGGGQGPTANGDGALVAKPKSKQGGGGGGDAGDGEDPEQAKLRLGLNSAIIRETPNVKWGDVAGLESAKQALQEAVILPVKFPQFFTGTMMAEEDAASRRERLMSLRLQAQENSASSSSSVSPASSSHSPSLPKFSNPFSDQPFLDSPNIPSQARTAGFDFYTDPVAAFRSSKGRGGRGGATWQQQPPPPSPFHATGSSFVHPPVVGHSFRGPPPLTPPAAAPLPAPPSYNHPPFQPSAPLPQGRGSWQSRGGGGGARGSWPGSSSQRMRPEMKQGSRAAKYPRRGGGEYERAQGGAVTAKERPDLFYSKSMLADPWKDLVVAEDTRQQG